MSADELIGESGDFLGGAAGWEIDRADYDRGTAEGTLVLATAEDFDESYQAALEDTAISDSRQSGPLSAFVRADLTYQVRRSGGQIFSVGSLCWIGALRRDKAVARITMNALRRFMAGPITERQVAST